MVVIAIQLHLQCCHLLQRAVWGMVDFVLSGQCQKLIVANAVQSVVNNGLVDSTWQSTFQGLQAAVLQNHSLEGCQLLDWGLMAASHFKLGWVMAVDGLGFINNEWPFC